MTALAIVAAWIVVPPVLWCGFGMVVQWRFRRLCARRELDRERVGL